MPQSVMPKLLNPFLKEIILVLIMLETRLKECFIQHYSVILGGDCKLSDKGFTDIDILLNENDEQFF